MIVEAMSRIRFAGGELLGVPCKGGFGCGAGKGCVAQVPAETAHSGFGQDACRTGIQVRDIACPLLWETSAALSADLASV
ncbi:hypothetical protein B2J88_50800 [Rhodococcus sp. SRB_17]|nr:hypothetical protein [Rhodococcus sp. SRB_17]